MILRYSNYNQIDDDLLEIVTFHIVNYTLLLSFLDMGNYKFPRRIKDTTEIPEESFSVSFFFSHPLGDQR